MRAGDGHALDRLARGRHRGGLAQPAELRSGAGHLHVRDDLRHLGRRLPLLRLARQAAHARLLGPRLAAFSRGGNLSQAGASLCALATTHLAAQTFIRRRSRAALVDAPVALLGLPARGCDHFSAGLRLDLLPDAAQRPDDLRHATCSDFRCRRFVCTRCLRRFCFTAWISPRCWCSAGSLFRCGGVCATGARKPCRPSRWIFCRSSCCSRFRSPDWR